MPGCSRRSEPVDVVFMGDSITEGWNDKRPGFFTRGRIDRGIGGQTTSQMVLRMYQRRRRAQAQGGAHHGRHQRHRRQHRPHDGRDDRRQFPRDERHRASGMACVLLAPIPPAASFPWRPEVRRARAIAELNRWLERFRGRERRDVGGLSPVLDDGSGAMKPGLASDGVHPNEAGYDAMATVIEPVLRRMFGGSITHEAAAPLRRKAVGPNRAAADVRSARPASASAKSGSPTAREQPLLVKYLFTSERLSIQVHPDDAQARARGLARGKSECWYILDAEPGATLGLGLTREVSAATSCAPPRSTARSSN